MVFMKQAAARLDAPKWRGVTVLRGCQALLDVRTPVFGDFGIARRNDAYYAISMQTISLKLPDDLLVQLDNEAKARRVTKSALIRESLEKALRKPAQGGEVSCYDLSSDLAGALKGLPEDLADNPKYMEGFGA